MKLPITWLCFSLLAPGALSNILAGPFQSVLLWYAYRMDVATFGSGKTLIAPDCIGSLPDKSCTFDEFLKYIQRTGPNTPAWTGSTSVGDELNPNPLAAASDLSDSGYSNTIEPSRLYPSQFPVRGVSPSFSAIFENIIDNIQACRSEGTADISDFMHNARWTMLSITDARMADQAQYVIQGLNQQLKDAGYSWTVETKTYDAPDSSTWEGIDTEGTINAHPGKDPGLYTAIRDYVANFATATDTNAQHARAIQACQYLQSRLMGDPSC